MLPQDTECIVDEFEVINEEKECPGNSVTEISFEADRDSNLLARWKLEQAEDIAQRDAKAQQMLDDWRDEALKELENWHAKQNEVLSKKKDANREAQDQFMKESLEQKSGQKWEKVCSLCDFNPKGNHNMKDTARMKSILLHLKQNPLVR